MLKNTYVKAKKWKTLSFVRDRVNTTKFCSDINSKSVLLKKKLKILIWTLILAIVSSFVKGSKI